MTPVMAEFINTFGAFGLALVAFSLCAGVVWVKVITPTLEAKNKVQERYVDSLESLLDNHKDASAASIEVQKETAVTLAEIGQSIEEARKNHGQILKAIDKQGR